MTPTQRSLAKLRAEGWLVAVVERWNPYALSAMTCLDSLTCCVNRRGPTGIL